MPGQDRLIDEIFGKPRLPQPVRCDKDDVLAFGEEVEREDAVDHEPMNLFGPVPLKISRHLEAAEARVFQPTLHALSRPGIEFGLDELLKQDDRAPAFLRRAGDEIIELVGGVKEAEVPQVITQHRRICALTDTLILDEDGVYDPAHYNDRLLLGLFRPRTPHASPLSDRLRPDVGGKHLPPEELAARFVTARPPR